MATKVTPTFLLKGIDPNEVLEKYKNGFFNRPIPKKTPIKIAQNATILAPVYGLDNNSPVFSIKDRNNNCIIVATSNHENFDVFTKNGGSLPVGGRCDHCKEDFNHTVIGYPVAYEEKSILEYWENNTTRCRVVYVFWVEGCHCSFECALGYLRMFANRPANYRDNSMSECERYLKFLYKLSHPTAGTLRPAQDPRILSTHNKGSLSRQAWSDNRHIYVRSDRVLMIPAKVEYVRNNFDTNPISFAIDSSNTNYSTIIPST
jgi:hypothetical protein